MAGSTSLVPSRPSGAAACAFQFARQSFDDDDDNVHPLAGFFCSGTLRVSETII